MSFYKLNYGINIWDLNVGITYRFKENDIAKFEEVLVKKKEFVILYNARTRQIAYNHPYLFVHRYKPLNTIENYPQY